MGDDAGWRTMAVSAKQTAENYTKHRWIHRTWAASGAAEVDFISEQALQPRERPSRFASKGQLEIDRYVWTQQQIGQPGRLPMDSKHRQDQCVDHISM